MTDEVKQRIGLLIEQAGDPHHRAMLLVLLSMVDSLMENTKINSELFKQVSTIKNQISATTVKRNMAIRFLDKTLPYMIAAMWASVAWTWSGITDLQKFQAKIETQHQMDQKK